MMPEPIAKTDLPIKGYRISTSQLDEHLFETMVFISNSWTELACKQTNNLHSAITTHVMLTYEWATKDDD